MWASQSLHWFTISPLEHWIRTWQFSEEKTPSLWGAYDCTSTTKEET
jgi:hypothetical protein